MKKKIMTNIEAKARGHIYTKESFESAAERINSDKPIFVTLGLSIEGIYVNLDRVVGTIKDAVVDDDGLYVDFELSKTPCGEIARALIEEKLNYRLYSVGIGDVDENNVVRNYSLKYVTVDFEPSKDS